MLVVGLLGGMAACATQHVPGDRVQIRFSTWGSAEEIAVVKHLVQRFEAQHPGIDIKLLHIPENYFQKLHILIAGGLTPDVMFVNSLGFSDYAENDIFQPLEPYLNKPQGELTGRVFFQPALAAFRWQGHVYAVPRDVSDLVVFYNRDLFQKANVSVPKADWTFADLLCLGQQLTRDTDGDGRRDQFGISFFAKPPLLWLPFVWSEGGEIFNPNLSAFLLDEPDAVEALQFYADLRNRWHVAPMREEVGSASMSQLFLQGKLAMLVGGRWTVPVLRQQAKFNWDVVPFPRGKNGSVVGVDASGYALSKTTAHPQESWLWITYLSSREAQEALAKSGLIVPARQDTAKSAIFMEPPPRNSWYFLEAIRTGRPSHIPVRWNEIAEELGLALEPVWEGAQTAQEAMQAVAPKIEAMLDE